MRELKVYIKVKKILLFLPILGSHTHLIHGVENVVLWRRIHEVELEQVLHAQGLEQEHDVGEVGALDLGDGGGEQLLPVLRVGNKKPIQKNPPQKNPPKKPDKNVFVFCFFGFLKIFNIL